MPTDAEAVREYAVWHEYERATAFVVAQAAEVLAKHRRQRGSTS